MKRRYKLLLIIVTGTIFTIFINNLKKDSKISIVALGDSFSVALTPYNVPGTSFTDYLKEYLDGKKKLDNYNYEYSNDHLKIKDLNEYIESNNIGKESKLPIKQVFAKAEIITIAVGVDEFGDLSLRKDIDSNDIESFLNNYEKLLSNIRDFYKKDIIVIGLYPVYNYKQQDVVELNSKLNVLCGKYNAKFIDILPYAINKEYFFKNDNYYMNYKVHKKIAEIIINSLNKK